MNQSKNKNMPVAYSYIRFSTRDQKKGDSLRRQLAGSEAYAKEHGLELDPSFKDEAVSGFKGANVAGGKLGEFLACVDSGEIPKGSYLIIENFDRLSREDVEVAMPRFLTLIAKGIVVVTLGSSPQKYDSAALKDNPWLLMGSLTEMVRANAESRRKSERVGAAWAQKRVDAREGKMVSQKVPNWLKIEGGKIVPIPERVKTINRIFRLFLSGLGQGVIARQLNQEEIPAFGKKGWHESYLHKLTNNRALLGEFQMCGKNRVPDGEPIKDYFPRVITDALFAQVKAARTKRINHGGRITGESKGLFSHMIHCAHCGGSVVMQHKKQHYLVCSSARRGVKCDYHLFNYSKFEENFLNWIVDWDYRQKGANAELEALEGKEAILAAKVESTVKGLDNLISKLEASGSATVAARIKKLEDQKRREEEELEAAKNDLVEYRGNLESLSKGTDNLKKAIQQEDRPALRVEIRKRVKEMTLVFDADKITFHGQPFCAVKLFGGETYHLLKDGEVMIWTKTGKKLVSDGLA